MAEEEEIAVASAEIKNFETPDEVLEFPQGRGEVVNIRGGKVLRLTLQPGWRWSDHVVGDEPVESVDWGGARVWGRASQ